MAIDILIVDDEADIRHLLASVLQDVGYVTRQAKNSQEALQLVNDKKPGLVILDVWLNNSALDGIQILEEIKKIYSDVPVIIISGHGTVDMAVSATKKGAYSFIAKPFKTDALLNTLSRALDTATLKSKNVSLQTKLGLGELTLVGACQKIVSVQKRIEELCCLNVPVLFTGETGTGKDIAANILHKKSGKSGYYVIFNAVYADTDVEKALFGSMYPRTSGVFEEASAGSLVIDNADVLPVKQQLQLARTIAEGRFIPLGAKKSIALSARIIVICRDETLLHPDLLVRLQNFRLRMPTLNERVSDMKTLAERFMYYRTRAQGRKAFKLSSEAITALSIHNWRGNMWEFLNVIDRILLLSKKEIVDVQIVKTALTLRENSSDISIEKMLMNPLREAREEFERCYLSFHLRRFNRNITKMAEFIGMDRAALSRKIKSIKIER